MNKKLLALLLIGIAFLASQPVWAQNDTTKYTNYRYLYGNKTPRVWAPQVLTPPSDTAHSKSGIATLDSSIYIGDGTRWRGVKSPVTNETLDTNSLKRNGKLYSKVPVLKRLSELRAIATADLDTGFVYKYNNGEYKYLPGDNTTADDTAVNIRTISGKLLQRQFVRVIYPEWWDAQPDTSNGVVTGFNSGPAFNKMFRWLERQRRGSYEVGFISNNYYTSVPIYLPNLLQTLAGQASPYLNISGAGVTIRTDQAITIFNRMPLTDPDVSLMLNNYKLLFNGIFLKGDRSTVGQVGMRLGAFQGIDLHNTHFLGFDTAFIGSFLLKPTIRDSYFSVNQKVDIKLQSLSGIVGAQTVPGSASNDAYIDNCRFDEYDGSFAAIMLLGNNNPVLHHNIIEGAQPRYGVYIDHLGSAVVQQVIIDDMWFEGNSGTPSVNFKIKGTGNTYISNLKLTYPDTLFDFSGSQSGAKFFISGIPYSGALANVPFIGDGAGMSGRSITIANCDTHFSDIMFNPAKWKEGIIPINMSTSYFEEGNGPFTIKSSGSIQLLPRQRAGAISDRYLYVDGNIDFASDNAASIGGTFNYADSRAKALHIGTVGVYIDNSARMYWGRAGFVTPDVSLGRDAIGRLGVFDNNNNYQKLKASIFTATQPSGYDSAIDISLFGPNDWPTIKIMQDYVNNNAPPIYFSAQFTGIGSPSDPYTIDTIYNTASKNSVVIQGLRTDSLVRNWPVPGGGSGQGRTVITHKSTIGDSLFIKINDSLYRPLKIIMGTNMSATKTDSTYTINGAAGSAEINTKDTTYTAAGTQSVLFATIIEFILVKPVSDLVAFKVGTSTVDNAFVDPTDCAGGQWTTIQVNAYLDATTVLYFAGITSSTQIKIVKKNLHE